MAASLKAKAWTFEAKAKAIGPEARAKAIKFGFEAPRGQGMASMITSLVAASSALLTHKISPLLILSNHVNHLHHGGGYAMRSVCLSFCLCDLVSLFCSRNKLCVDFILEVFQIDLRCHFAQQGHFGIKSTVAQKRPKLL